MGNACLCPGKQVYLIIVQLHAMGVPDMFACPAQLFCIIAWPLAELGQ